MIIMQFENQLSAMQADIERVLAWTNEAGRKIKRVQDDHAQIQATVNDLAKRRDMLDDDLDGIKIEKNQKYNYLLKELKSLEKEREADRKSEIFNFVEYANQRTSRPTHAKGQSSPYSTSFSNIDNAADEQTNDQAGKSSIRDFKPKSKQTTSLLRRMKEED